MEDNLIYKDNSIFTKIPHIYLNLNTTITENLNVDNITNLNTLNVDTYSTLRGQLISDNIYNNKNLIVHGTSTLDGTTNINNTLYLNHTEDSSNITSGSIITYGGIGISKNAFIGGNTTVENNLNVFKSTNITENLNVLSVSTLYNLNVTTNTNLDTLYVSKDSILKQLLTTDNIINNNDLIVHGTSTLHSAVTFNSKLNLNGTDDSSNSNEGVLVISGGVGIAKNVSISGNTTIENNLNVYKSTNIIENLNVVGVSTLYNLNVTTNTNLDTLYVSKASLLKQLLRTDNIINNQDLTIHGISTLHGDVIFNSKLNLDNTYDSSNSNEGVLVVKGGVGIAKNVSISGNTTIENNLNVYKSTNITENLNVLDTTVLNKLNVLNNVNIIQNLNVNESVTISKNLNILSNTITQQSNIVYKDIIGHNSLTVSKDSQFKSNLTVFGNFAVLGETFNIVSDKTFVADPLVVFGMNQAQTFDSSYGGFVINHINTQDNNNDVYSGIVRKPSSDDFYLLKNIKSIEDDINSTLRNPDLNSLSTHNKYGNFHVNNININNTTSNTLINLGKITAKDLDITNNVSVSNDVKISGNLIVTGNSAIVITNHFDINDPIFTISNNSPNHDRGMLVNNGRLQEIDHNLYSGLIRKDSDSNFYLLDNIDDPLAKTVPTTYKSTLVLKNINTSYTSHLHGLKILENNDNNNTSSLVATFPNNSTSEDIIFYKKTKFNDHLTINSNVNLNGNLSVSDKFILLNTNTFISHGTTQLLGNTVITGRLDLTKSVINCDHINIKSFFNNLGNTRTKDLDADNIKIVDKLRFPIRDTISSANDADFPANKTGYVIFNKTRRIYEGFDGNNWIPLGLSPGQDSTETTINSNLNVTLNINCDNNLIRHNLEVDKDAIIEGDLTVKKYIEVTKNITSTAIITNLLDVKQTSIFRNKMEILNETSIHKNLNVYQNLNIADKITSNTNIVKHNLIIPIHDINSNTLDTINGSIYYNTTNNLYYGYNQNSWLPLGGINPYIDTTIYHNLIVKKNINVEQNLNVAQNLNVSQNINVSDTIITDTSIVLNNLVIPNHAINSNTLDSINGSIYYNTANNLYYGYNNDKWLPLGGINPLEDTTIDHNLIVKKNINVEQNLNVAQNLTVSQNLNVSDTITTNNNIVLENLVIPKHNKDSNTLNQVEGSIYYNTTDNLYYSRNNLTWLPLGGIHPNEDTIINHNLNIKKNLNIEQNLNVADRITTNNNIVLHNLVIPKHNTDSNTLNQLEGSIYYNTTDNLYYSRNNINWLPLGGINPNQDTVINHNLNIINKTQTNSLLVNGMSHFDGHVYVDNTLSSKQLIIPSNHINKTINDTGSLYINYNGAFSQLKLRLNDQDNIIPFNNNPIVQLNSSTDLFQFYNVHNNQPIFGNRITGLNDPAFNSFTKFYTLKEFTFFQETLLTDIEFYVSHNIHNNTTDLEIKIEIIKNSVESPIFSKTFDSISVATVNFSTLTITDFLNSDNKFKKDDKIKLKLTLLNSQNSFNGHEIFVKLHGHAKIHPNVEKLHILDTTDRVDPNSIPALLCMGGAEFKKSVSASSFSPFTGCHISTMITPSNYNILYSYYRNNIYIFKPGLIVSVDNSTHINIDSSKFNIKLTDKITDKTVFGVINSYLGNQEYYINSLGEGAIWVSNINGDIQNGDYIMSSNISGYGCKQNDDILHSYTVAKCCSIINWNSINSYINYYSKQYKIAFVACTYHCG
jgi:hypothetical protein